MNLRTINFSKDVPPMQILGEENVLAIKNLITETCGEGITVSDILNAIHERIELDDMQWTAAAMIISLMMSDM